jgi:hypothetical protein
MIAAHQGSKAAAIRWLPRTRQSPHRLPTPYGVLDVWPYFAGCWQVYRDSVPLVGRYSRLAAVFTSVGAAKAAGLLHLSNGFGASEPFNVGFRWKMDLRTGNRFALQSADHLARTPSVSDDHEWGRRELDRLLKECPDAPAATADENLIIDITRAARWWRLPPPRWIRHARGLYHLNTPYGLLAVRRMIGWTVERNGMPLVWWCGGGKRVIFDKLEDAKTSALVHLTDEGTNIPYLDGTRWREPAEGETAAQRLSAA